MHAPVVAEGGSRGEEVVEVSEKGRPGRWRGVEVDRILLSRLSCIGETE